MKLLHIWWDTIRQQMQLHLPTCIVSPLNSIMPSQCFDWHIICNAVLFNLWEVFLLTLDCVAFHMTKFLPIKNQHAADYYVFSNCYHVKIFLHARKMLALHEVLVPTLCVEGHFIVLILWDIWLSLSRHCTLALDFHFHLNGTPKLECYIQGSNLWCTFY